MVYYGCGFRVQAAASKTSAESFRLQVQGTAKMWQMWHETPQCAFVRELKSALIMDDLPWHGRRDLISTVHNDLGMEASKHHSPQKHKSMTYSCFGHAGAQEMRTNKAGCRVRAPDEEHLWPMSRHVLWRLRVPRVRRCKRSFRCAVHGAPASCPDKVRDVLPNLQYALRSTTFFESPKDTFQSPKPSTSSHLLSRAPPSLLQTSVPETLQSLAWSGFRVEPFL